jgi:hypothetical protein
MAGNFVTPSTDSLADMLGMLYGGDIAVSDSGAAAADGYAARMVDDSGNLVALFVCDYNFVGFAGAALSMMPVGGAEDMIAEKDFSKTILDNYYEVMNICTRLLMSDSSDHLKLDNVVGPEAAGAEIAALSASKTVSFTVAIPKYGSGIFSCYIQ